MLQPRSIMWKKGDMQWAHEPTEPTTNHIQIETNLVSIFREIIGLEEVQKSSVKKFWVPKFCNQ